MVGRKEFFWKGNLTETKLEAGHQCYHVALEITTRHVHLAREDWGLEYLEMGSRGQEYLGPADLRWLENDNWKSQLGTLYMSYFIINTQLTTEILYYSHFKKAETRLGEVRKLARVLQLVRGFTWF